MYSGPDLLAEGFPHSDIRGSTIARISPRLIAACHVLHRLLAPRHPPNALLILIIHHRPRAGPNRPRGHPPERPDRHASNRTTAQHRDTQLLTGSQPARHSTHQFRFTCQTTWITPGATAPRAGFSGSLPRGLAPRGLSPPWRRSDSNRRPPACKAGALPLSYAPSREPFNGLAPDQLITGPEPCPRGTRMGQGGLEPPTPRLSSVCSNQLSYWPKQQPARKRVPARPERQGKDARPAPRPCPRARVPAPPRFSPSQAVEGVRWPAGIRQPAQCPGRTVCVGATTAGNRGPHPMVHP